MAIKLSEGLHITSSDPVDSRIVFATLNEMKALHWVRSYSGLLAYVVETNTFYVYNANNEEEPETGKWRPLSSGNGIKPWTANTKYKVDDFVYYEGLIYRCLSEHTSGATFDKTKWEPMSTDVAPWVAGADYTEDYIVIYNNKLYRCLEAHTASADFKTDYDAGKWELLYDDFVTCLGIIDNNVTAFPTKRDDGSELKLGDFMLLDQDATYPITIGDITFNSPQGRAVYYGAPVGWKQEVYGRSTEEDVVLTEIVSGGDDDGKVRIFKLKETDGLIEKSDEDRLLAKVSDTGKAEDVSLADADEYYTAEDVEEGFKEVFETKFNNEVFVNELPTEDIKEHTLYVLKTSNDTREAYVYDKANTEWVQLSESDVVSEVLVDGTLILKDEGDTVNIRLKSNDILKYRTTDGMYVDVDTTSGLLVDDVNHNLKLDKTEVINDTTNAEIPDSKAVKDYIEDELEYVAYLHVDENTDAYFDNEQPEVLTPDVYLTLTEAQAVYETKVDAGNKEDLVTPHNASLVAGINDAYELASRMHKVSMEVVSALPETGDTNIIYLVPVPEMTDVYMQNIWNQNDQRYYEIGTTNISHADIYTKTESDSLFVAKTEYATATDKGIVAVGDNVDVVAGVISVPNASNTKAGVVQVDQDASHLFKLDGSTLKTDFPAYTIADADRVLSVTDDGTAMEWKDDKPLYRHNLVLSTTQGSAAMDNIYMTLYDRHNVEFTPATLMSFMEHKGYFSCSGVTAAARGTNTIFFCEVTDSTTPPAFRYRTTLGHYTVVISNVSDAISLVE